jgi:deoxyribonuclease-4
MLVGGHVSSSGGLVKSYDRGIEFGCDALQIFNQSPRMWRPTEYRQDDIDEFRERMADGPIKSVVIHAVYLINAASNDAEIREKSLASLTQALRVGDAIGADGVVFHPGSTVGEPLDESIDRVGDAIRRVLGESESCPLLLEDTAGAGGTIGRDFHELARLIELGGGGKRLGICLDSCHLLASGYDISTADKLAGVVDECDSIVGLDRLRCLHVNDSMVALGSNRDRHEILPGGELGTRLPVGAALRGAAGAARDEAQRRAGRHREGPAQEGPGGEEAAEGEERLEPVAQVEPGGLGGGVVEEARVDARERVAVAVIRAFHRGLALGDGLTRHLHAAEAVARALGLVEDSHVDLDPEHLVHAAHEASAGLVVVVQVEVLAARRQASGRVHHAVAERAALTAFAGLGGVRGVRHICECNPRDQALEPGCSASFA